MFSFASKADIVAVDAKMLSAMRIFSHMNRHLGFPAAAIVLLFMILFSLYMAMNRIYQVDECQNLYMARIIGTGQTGDFFTSAFLWLVGPLAWLAAAARSSASLFDYARGVFLCIFWLNILLMTLATGTRIRSIKGIIVLLFTASLAPLWDYGIEVRHDNLILTGLLLMWLVGRTFPKGNRSYFILGALTTLLLFVTFKSIVYVIPLSALFLAFPPPAHMQNRTKLASFWLAGLFTAFLICLFIYISSGLWNVYLSSLKGANTAGRVYNPWMTLGRALEQAPLLLILAAAGLWHTGRKLRHGFRSAFTWESAAPEGFLFLVALTALFINPTPFPYNLVNLVPFCFLFSCRFAVPWMERINAKHLNPALGLALLFSAQFIPFIIATRRHVDWTSSRQKTLMRAAEALTDPERDRVYDAIGMVPTRQSSGFYWYLHSLNIESFMGNKIPKVSYMLEEKPAAVFIPSYRTDWLPESEMGIIKKRYVPLSDDFWVRGERLPRGGGFFEVELSGRYQLLENHHGTMLPARKPEMDDALLSSSIVELHRGNHHLKCASDLPLIVIWIGPVLKNLPDLGNRDHTLLFVNWY